MVVISGIGFRIRTDDNLSVEKTRVILPLPVLLTHSNIIEDFPDNYMYLKIQGLRINVFLLDYGFEIRYVENTERLLPV